MTPRGRTIAVRAVRPVAAAVLGGAFVAGACASTPDPQRTTFVGPLTQPDQTLAPDYAQFKAGVDEYLGQRCATLDCHGQFGRPLRLFGPAGLRAFDAANPGTVPMGPNQPNGTPLTEDEHRANFLAVVGLEPEVMAQVIAEGGVNPKKLLLIRKPLLLEGHKGGQVMTNEADDGYRCVTSWLAGTLDQAACDSSLNVP